MFLCFLSEMINCSSHHCYQILLLNDTPRDMREVVSLFSPGSLYSRSSCALSLSPRAANPAQTTRCFKDSGMVQKNARWPKRGHLTVKTKWSQAAVLCGKSTNKGLKLSSRLASAFPSPRQWSSFPISFGEGASHSWGMLVVPVWSISWWGCRSTGCSISSQGLHPNCKEERTQDRQQCLWEFTGIFSYWCLSICISKVLLPSPRRQQLKWCGSSG